MTHAVRLPLIAALALAVAAIGAQSDAQDSDAEPDAIRDATARFNEWLGPPTSSLPPSSAMRVSGARWLSRRGDRSDDRLVVDAISRAYFPSSARPSEAVFFEGIRQYVAVRAIHDLFEGSHYFSRRYAGRIVPHVVRSALLSLPPESPQPQMRWFPELSGLPADADEALLVYAARPEARIVDAMFTLERLIGWPTLQQALAALRASENPPAIADFVVALDRVSGRHTGWFLDQVQAGTTFDYAVLELSNTPAEGGFETAIKVGRAADGVFPVDVAIRFADGSSIRESWDGQTREMTFRYTSRSAAVRAIVDPDKTLPLDRNRANNVEVRDQKVFIPAIRWTLQWLIWLEDAMLTYSALI